MKRTPPRSLPALTVAITFGLVTSGAIFHCERQRAAVAAVRAANPSLFDDIRLFREREAKPELPFAVFGDRPLEMTDAELAALAKTHRITDLHFRGPLTDASAELIAGLPKIRSVRMIGSSITDRGLRMLAKLPELDCLELIGSQITDTGLAALSGKRSLATLKLTDCRITDNGLSALARLPGLKTLSLAGTAVTDRGLEKIPVEQLESLDLSRTLVKNELHGGLRPSESLWCLSLESSQISAMGLTNLRRLSLRRLDLGNNLLTDVDLTCLAGLDELLHLDLSATRISDDGLSFLAALPQLQYLKMSQTSLGNDSLRYIGNLHGLKVVVLDRTYVTDDGLPKLQGRRAGRIAVPAEGVTESDLVNFEDRFPEADGLDISLSVQGRTWHLWPILTEQNHGRVPPAICGFGDSANFSTLLKRLRRFSPPELP